MFSCNFLKRINKGQEEILSIDPSFPSVNPKTILITFDQENLNFKIDSSVMLSHPLSENYQSIAVSLFGEIEVNIDSFEI